MSADKDVLKNFVISGNPRKRTFVFVKTPVVMDGLLLDLLTKIIPFLRADKLLIYIKITRSPK
jgi:hypothetical protein